MSLTITFYNNIKYTKDDFMSRERDFFGNGVVRLDDFLLTFAPEAPMTVQVGAGVAWVDGYRIENAGAAISLMFAAASAQPRIDIVQIGHDDDLSQAVLQVKQGVPGAVPIEPGADPGYFKLYAVRVNVGATSVTEADIIDCRALVPLNVSGTQINLDGAASTGTNMFTGTQTAPKFVATGQTPLQVQDLTALPTVGPKGTTCVVGGLWHVSDGTAWKAMSPNEYTHPATHPASMITVEDAGDLYTATHVEGVLEELFTSVSDGKATIATAITGKKGTVAGTAPHTFQQLVDGINGIKTGQGNAVEAQVLQGVTFTNQDGVLRTGTMPNKTGSQSAALAWSNSDANTTVHVKPAKGYYDGTDSTMVYISDSALIPSNIRSGKTVFGVAGNLVDYNTPGGLIPVTKVGSVSCEYQYNYIDATITGTVYSTQTYVDKRGQYKGYAYYYALTTGTQIYVVDPTAGTLVTTFAAPTQVHLIGGVDASGNIYYAYNDTVYKLSPTGVFLASWTVGMNVGGSGRRPMDVDSSGNVYCGAFASNFIEKWKDGVLEWQFTLGGTNPGTLWIELASVSGVLFASTIQNYTQGGERLFRIAMDGTSSTYSGARADEMSVDPHSGNLYYYNGSSIYVWQGYAGAASFSSISLPSSASNMRGISATKSYFTVGYSNSIMIYDGVTGLSKVVFQAGIYAKPSHTKEGHLLVLNNNAPATSVFKKYDLGYTIL